MLNVVPLSELCRSDRLRETYVVVASTNGDVYHTLEYLTATEESNDGIVLCAIFQYESATVVYPFVKKKVPYLINGNEYFDISTPYEYGGPISNVLKGYRSIVGCFYSEFDSYCQNNRIVAEFVRFDPLLGNRGAFGSVFRVRRSCENVVIDLSKSEEQLVSEYHKNNRRDIRLATRRGVTVCREKDRDKSLKIFIDLYLHTMKLRGAKKFYFFSKQYFRKLFGLPEEMMGVYVARDAREQPISAAIFLTYQNLAHYHLSGTLKQFSSLCPNNLLLHSAILDYKKLGMKFLHLGGASGWQPGLYHFKSKFSTDRSPYFVGERVIDEHHYQQLIDCWQKENPELPVFERKYFPQYRAES